MRCEVCGRKIYGHPLKAMIEGAELTVCSRCAQYGKIIREEKRLDSPFPRKKTRIKPPSPKPKRSKPPLTVETTLELVEDFSTKIRQAREKLGMSQEDLGRKIKEKVSVLKKLETGKMTPDNRLATKLEHALKIKLLIPASEKKIPQVSIPETATQKLTLGDLIKLDDEESGERKQRKQS